MLSHIKCAKSYQVWRSMEYTKNAIIRKNGKFTILGNIQTGKWIRINNELYEKFEKQRICKRIGKTDFDQKVWDLIKLLMELRVISEGSIEQEDKIRAVTFAITNRCNLSCLHCGYSASPDQNYELDKEVVLAALTIMKDVDVIGITGGEPMFHKDFPEIAAFIGKNMKGKKTLMTNATLIHEGNVDLIVENFDDIAISLDAASEKTCDEMRGKGVYKKVVSAIKLLQSKNFKNISLSFSETELNKHERDLFIRMCEEWQIKYVLRSFWAVGRGMENKSRLDMKEDVDKDAVMQPDREKLMEYRKNLQLATKCGAGVNSIYIQYNGDIYPCPVAGVDEKMKMGNIKESEHFQSLILNRDKTDGFKYYKSISCKETGRCSTCEVRDFCWRCLQEYYQIFKDSSQDAVCTERKNFLKSIVWGE